MIASLWRTPFPHQKIALQKRSHPVFDLLTGFVSVVICFVFAFAVVNYVIGPIQSRLVGEGVIASLIFLPHGVRLLSTWLLRGQAVLPLAIGEAVSTFYIWQPDFPPHAVVLASIVGGSCCYILLEGFRMLGVDLYPSDIAMPDWKALIMIAGLSSFINAIGHGLAYAQTYSSLQEILQIVFFVLGDTTGTVCLMFLLLFAMRYLRQ
ncbi:MAG: hypothetical protein KGN33_12760 [Paracoccaceae bacterium]|nr:hypothetical protein [Paracoccaceae bacterium]